jgi:hypothetical protein
MIAAHAATRRAAKVNGNARSRKARSREFRPGCEHKSVRASGESVESPVFREITEQ